MSFDTEQFDFEKWIDLSFDAWKANMSQEEKKERRKMKRKRRRYRSKAPSPERSVWRIRNALIDDEEFDEEWENLREVSLRPQAKTRPPPKKARPTPQPPGVVPKSAVPEPARLKMQAAGNHATLHNNRSSNSKNQR